ncbi:MAG TPA: septum site-determining protein MinC [Clostridiaceae bacterium]|nr:septum site-determining protein MinC [Clostridiaceae bacterium]
MEESSITFKATANGLILIMKEEEDFEAVIEQISKKLSAAGKFFKGASLDVKYRGKVLNEEQEQQIIELMENKTGAKVKSLQQDTTEPEQLEVEQADNLTGMHKIKKFFFTGINEGITKFYRGTVRSGQLISFDGNVIVIGDVNPGGEIEATGNIIVMGSLRGIVHAGADGNKEAIVAALNLQPTQLRIANIITRCPDEEETRNVLVPELAFVKDDMVYIERFLPQYK